MGVDVGEMTVDVVALSHTAWNGLWFWEESVDELEYASIEWVYTGPAMHGTDNVSVSTAP